LGGGEGVTRLGRAIDAAVLMLVAAFIGFILATGGQL
jgi:hypothetical protein